MLIFYILKSGLSEPGCFRSVDLWYNSSDKGLIQIVIDKDWILRFCILIYPVLEKKKVACTDVLPLPGQWGFGYS